MDERFRFLAHFFGTKGENEDYLTKLLTLVLSDYAHWRRNYFPDDPYLMTPSLQRQLEDETETLTKETHTMLAGLRRSFPFYSPRYIAHQQSETSIASVIGSIAGTLYNSNNVTPESGIATVEWELDACNALLRMLGYEAPPDPPERVAQFEDYTKSLQREFGWCHLASGGTVANIEALWVARTIKYFPLCVRDACRDLGLVLKVKISDESQDENGGGERDITTVEPLKLLGVKPNESIFLLSKFVQEVTKAKGWSLDTASARAWEVLNKSPYSPANGFGRSFADYPPTIFVSGAGHYSVEKAADILGVGRSAVRRIPMDSRFRLDVSELESEMRKAISEGRTIVAVVAIIGTTEEGAVDPLHDIIRIRTKFEEELGQSFWIHADAAWGGFIRSVFVDPASKSDDHVTLRLLKKRLFRLSELFGKDPYRFPFKHHPEKEPREWVSELLSRLHKAAPQTRPGVAPTDPPASETIQSWFDAAEASGNYREVLGFVHAGVKRFIPEIRRTEFAIKLIDRVTDTRDFVSDTVEMTLASYRKTLHLRWPHDYDIGMSFFAMKDADSITVDPHKMGYTVYPNGAIAFKNDRVRHFIRQEAPYITSTNANSLVHLPLRRAEKADNDLYNTKISTDAFGPFTLEGSRPSAPACSLWLASRTMPFDRDHHGTIIRSSLLAARILHEWIERWAKIAETVGEDTRYELVAFSANPPDTNIVIFGVKEKGNSSIESFNQLNEMVYSRFAIQSERGSRKHSYAQPFFLSKTEFRQDHYPFSTLQEFLKRYEFRNAKAEYPKRGLVVLRATVMNPYILPIDQITDRNLIREFLRQLHRVVEKILPTFSGTSLN